MGSCLPSSYSKIIISESKNRLVFLYYFFCWIDFLFMTDIANQAEYYGYLD